MAPVEEATVAVLLQNVRVISTAVLWNSLWKSSSVYKENIKGCDRA